MVATKEPLIGCNTLTKLLRTLLFLIYTCDLMDIGGFILLYTCVCVCVFLFSNQKENERSVLLLYALIASQKKQGEGERKSKREE